MEIGEKMKSNVRIISLFTIFLILAVGVNVFPRKEGGSNDKLNFYTSAYTNWQTISKIDNFLLSNDVKTSKYEKDEDADIKLKYSSMILSDERKMYDIYQLYSDKLIAVTSGSNVNIINSQNLKEILQSQSGELNGNLIVASPCAYNWLLDHDYIKKGEIKVHIYLPEIIKEDQAVIGIAFESEIEELKQYHFNALLSNSSNKEILSDTFYLLLKKGRIKQKVAQGLIDELKKGSQ